MRKTALLTGVTGLLLMTAPALAQDPAPSSAALPAVEQAAAERPTLTLQPGSDVKGSDGTVLGQLEGARNTDAGQELTVRGADGLLRGVPVSGGVRQDGEGVAVGWTSVQFTAAPSLTEAAADAAEPAAAPEPPEAGMVPTTPPSLRPATDPAESAPNAGMASNPDPAGS